MGTTHYDLLLVGAGLFSAVIAEQAARKGKKCLVLERRAHAGGNIYTEKIQAIEVHIYGAHIFHTDRKDIWEYVNSFAEFNRYTNSPVADYNGHMYNLPFNMNTFNKIWPDVITPAQAEKRIAEQAAVMKGRTPANLEEQAISLVGTDIYRLLIREYTEKQWGRPCTELPPEIIKRLPVRFIYDNNYFNDKYQGIPIGGYTQIIEKMFAHADVQLTTDFLADKTNYEKIADTLVYTGMIDEYFGYELGNLEYRSLRFNTETLPIENYQGNAVVNYTSSKVPYTRIIEHKHFEGTQSSSTVITREYPVEWKKGDEPYYPVNDKKNTELFAGYKELAAKTAENGTPHVIFGGRLGMYKYFDMDDTIAAAFELAEKIL
jgi:UDP-galactopyranose mutase